MKHLTRFLSLVVLTGTAIFLSNCGSDGGDEKSVQEQQLDQLKGTWTLQSAEFNGDADDRFAGTVTLNISGTYSENGTYDFTLSSTSQVNASPWPPAVKWKFGSAPTSSIIRLDSQAPVSDDEDVSLGYTLSSNTLTITYSYEGAGFTVGRSKSTTGDWELVFTK